MKKLLLILFVIVSMKTYAQEKNALGFSLIYGPKVFSSYNSPLYGTYKGFGFEYKIAADQNLEWVNDLNIKSININTSFTDMIDIGVNGYDGVFGKNITLSTGLDIDIFNLNGFRFIFSPEAGLLCSTKDFYNTDNHNVILGNNFNFLLGGKLKFLVPLDNELNLQFGGGIDHSSNSRTSLPNNGLNRIGLFFGATSDFAEPNFNRSNFDVKEDAFVVDLVIGYTGELKTGYFINKKTGKGMYPDTVLQGRTPSIQKFGLSLGYTHHLNSLFGLNVSSDLIYSPTTLDWDRFFQTYVGEYSSYHPLNVGVSLGGEMLFGKVAFTGNYGYFVLGTPMTDKRFYGTISGKYFFTPNFGVEVKSYPSNFGSVGFCLKL